MFVQTITAAQVLAALTSDTTQFKGANIDLIPSQCFMLEFWGDGLDIALTTANADYSLGTITLPAISDVTIEQAYILFRCDALRDTSGAGNRLDQNETIQVKENAAGAYTTGINLDVNQFYVMANATEGGGTAITGDVDIQSEVDAFGDTYAFQWTSGRCLGNNLTFYQCRIGLRLICKVA